MCFYYLFQLSLKIKFNRQIGEWLTKKLVLPPAHLPDLVGYGSGLRYQIDGRDRLRMPALHQWSGKPVATVNSGTSNNPCFPLMPAAVRLANGCLMEIARMMIIKYLYPTNFFKEEISGTKISKIFRNAKSLRPIFSFFNYW